MCALFACNLGDICFFYAGFSYAGNIVTGRVKVYADTNKPREKNLFFIFVRWINRKKTTIEASENPKSAIRLVIYRIKKTKNNYMIFRLFLLLNLIAELLRIFLMTFCEKNMFKG